MAMEDPVDWSFDSARPIAPQVYKALREQIVRTRLKPGNRISESEIARSCHVSRQPVREAFIKLSEQGLLSILPQRGTIVRKISYAAVLDARFLREAIESDIVKIVAARRDPALVATLRGEIHAQRAIPRNEPQEFIRLDERFHRTLAEAAGTVGAWKLVEGLKSQMDRVRFLSLGRFPVAPLIDQHAGIVDTIAAGDVGGAERAIRLHLREVLKDLPEILATNSEYFDLPGEQVPRPVQVPIQGGET